MHSRFVNARRFSHDSLAFGAVLVAMLTAFIAAPWAPEAGHVVAKLTQQSTQLAQAFVTTRA